MCVIERSRCTVYNMHQEVEALYLGVKWLECINHKQPIAITFEETQRTIAEIREDEWRWVEQR
jgi:hypothetical protein